MFNGRKCLQRAMENRLNAADHQCRSITKGYRTAKSNDSRILRKADVMQNDRMS